MITQSESGLTTLQYDALKDARTDAIYRLKAYRWLPSSASVQTIPGHSKAFDMEEFGGKLYAVYDKFVKALTTTTWDQVTGYTTPTGFVNTVPYSMISDDALYIFAKTNSGISYITYDGSSWGSWTQIISDVNIIHFSAVSKNRIHYITYDSALNNYNLQVYDTGVITSSNIYWPFFIYDFDAINYNGRDVLIISTHVPGTVSAKYLNNKVVKYALDAGGLIAFTYKYGTWSDHIPIDILDEMHEGWRYRNVPRLSVVNGKLWLLSLAGDGTEKYPFTMYRFYTSIDGRHWSHGEYFPSDKTDKNGCVMAYFNNDVYIFQSRGISKLTPALIFDTYGNYTPLDLTDYILSLEVTRQDMQQLSAVLNNETAWIQSSILSGGYSIILILETGYWVNEEKLFVQTGMFEFDGITVNEDLPEHSVEISARDFLGWMETKYQSEQFKWWQPPLVAGDEYVDNTGTGYGGMAHTAIQKGSWITDANKLYLQDNKANGMVFSAFSTDTWNGQFSAQYKLSKANDNEFAGLVVRGQDYDNCLIFQYKQFSDQLRLTLRIDGVDDTQWVSSPIGWNDTKERWLRIEFYYCRVLVYTADNENDIPGAWTLQATVILNGRVNRADPKSIIQVGSVGFTGYGYSNMSKWTPDPGVIPAPVLPPLPAPPVLPAGTRRMAVWLSNKKLAITTDFDTPASLGGPHWTKINLASSILGTSSDAIVDAFSPFYLGTGSAVNIWVATTFGLYYVSDIFNTPIVTLKYTYSSSHIRTLATERGYRNYIATISRTASIGQELVYSIDNINFNSVVAGSGSTADLHSLHLSGHIDGQIYLIAPSSHGNRLFRTNIKSGTPAFTDITPSIIPDDDNHTVYQIYVPYSESSDDSVYYLAYNDNGILKTLKHIPIGDTVLNIDGGRATYDARKAVSICPVDSTTVMAVTMSGISTTTNVSVSRTSGSSWTKILSTSTIHQLDIAGDDPNVAFLWGDNGQIQYVTLSGTTATLDSRVGNLAETSEIQCIFGG